MAGYAFYPRKYKISTAVERTTQELQGNARITGTSPGRQHVTSGRWTHILSKKTLDTGSALHVGSLAISFYTSIVNRLIIGLAGDPGSGKSALAGYLAAHHGFYHFEGSAGIRDAAIREDTALRSRHDYSDFHARLQKRLGKDILAQSLLARPDKRLVFAGIRSVHNARTLQKAGGLVIGLTCPLEVCYSRTDQTKSFEDFKREAEEEWHSPDGYGADLQPTLAVADLTLDTVQPLDACYRFLDEVVATMNSNQ